MVCRLHSLHDWRNLADPIIRGLLLLSLGCAAQAQQMTCQNIGGTMYCNGPNGQQTSCQTIGGTTYCNGTNGQQMTCQNIGGTVYCNGNPGQGTGPTISPVPLMNFGAMQAEQQAMQAQAEAARAQADLARAQAEAIRQQTLNAQQHEFLDQVASASDDQLQNALPNLDKRASAFTCRISADCRSQIDFARQAIYSEISKRAEARVQAPINPPPAPLGQSARGGTGGTRLGSDDGACARAQKYCAGDSAFLCKGMRQDFIDAGSSCPGVTDR
jgi:hypothetical protein